MPDKWLIVQRYLPDTIYIVLNREDDMIAAVS